MWFYTSFSNGWCHPLVFSVINSTLLSYQALNPSSLLFPPPSCFCCSCPNENRDTSPTAVRDTGCKLYDGPEVSRLACVTLPLRRSNHLPQEVYYAHVLVDNMLSKDWSQWRWPQSPSSSQHEIHKSSLGRELGGIPSLGLFYSQEFFLTFLQ